MKDVVYELGPVTRYMKAETRLEEQEQIEFWLNELLKDQEVLAGIWLFICKLLENRRQKQIALYRTRQKAFAQSLNED